MSTSPPVLPGTLRRWQVPTLPGFEIAYCDRLTFRPENRYVFDTYTITLIEQGQGRYLRGGQAFDGVGGAIALSAPGDVVGSDSRAGTFSCRNLYLAPAFVEQLVVDRAQPHARLGVFDRPFAVDRRGWAAMLQATEGLGGADNAQGRETRLLQALRAFGLRDDELDRPSGSERAAVRRVRELLLDRLDQSVTLDELPAVACLNKFHLLRVFRAETGCRRMPISCGRASAGHAR